ncbi:hypothetical protein [Leucobacter sp. NPDC077196]|uniref:hypothetical protein n=1 Tax=Leucobacter sp. NPDC077196 TaxID=3154959 RepID=UPI003429BCD8
MTETKTPEANEDALMALDVHECFERLTKPWTLHAPDSETGHIVARLMPALLPELRDAVFGGMESTGGSASFGARLPISDGALDLYETIDQQIAEAWASAFPGQVPTVDVPERLLSQVVAVAKQDELVTVLVAEQRVEHGGERDEHWWVERKPVEFTLVALLRRWVRQVMEFFNPPRTREIAAPCIQCGVEWAARTSGGEHVPYRVFVFVQDADRCSCEIRCFACGGSWGPGLFQFVAASLGESTARPHLTDSPSEP